jgi:hypothetical protein
MASCWQVGVLDMVSSRLMCAISPEWSHQPPHYRGTGGCINDRTHLPSRLWRAPSPLSPLVPQAMGEARLQLRNRDSPDYQGVFRIIGMPPVGRRVTRRRGSGLWPGCSRSRKGQRRLARTTVASIGAKLCPMQMRGPAPNGRYANRSRAFTASGSKRSGSKRSGSCQSFSCRCRA